MENCPSCCVEVSRAYNDNEQLLETPMYTTLYKRTLWRECIFWTCVVVTCGLFGIVCYWWPPFYTMFRYSKTTHLPSVHRVLIMRKDGKLKAAKAKHINLPVTELELATCPFRVPDEASAEKIAHTILFEYFNLRYIYQLRTRVFDLVQFHTELPAKTIYKLYNGGVCCDTTRTHRQTLYGLGCIDIKVPALYRILVEEILHPFYVFQIFSIILWLQDEYYMYAFAIIFITSISLSQEAVTIRQNHKRLRRIANFETPQSIKTTEHSFDKKHPTEVVPGDIIELETGIASCDMILLQGSLLVDESMISGESVPVLKSPLDAISKYYSDSPVSTKLEFQNLQYLIFGGTNIVHVKDTTKPSQGLVIRTGFSTIQGRMMRDIMYPKRNEFIRQTYKYLLMLIIIAFVCSILSLFVSIQYDLNGRVVFSRFIDTFTNAIPPVLPTTMLIGANFAVSRLYRFHNMMCIVPSKINIAGLVNTFVFDKTGTLTENTYSIMGFVSTKITELSSRRASLGTQPMLVNGVHPYVGDVPSSIITKHSSDGSTGTPDDSYLTPLLQKNKGHDEHYKKQQKDKRHTSFSLEFTPVLQDIGEAPLYFREGMAACQSLSVVANNDVVGDLMEVQLLNYSKWTLSEDTSQFNMTQFPCPVLAVVIHPTGNNKISILRRNVFCPKIQRMSVCTYHHTQKKYIVYCKGSPEQLEHLCTAESLPHNYHSLLQEYTTYGTRVLAFGYKILDEFHVNYRREIFETDLTFTGFAFFANKLKSETYRIIQSLKEAGCRCLLATGDNPFTSVSVGIESSILEATPQTIVLVGMTQRDAETKRRVNVSDLDLQSQSTNSQTGGSSNDDTSGMIVWLPFRCDTILLENIQRRADHEIEFNITEANTTGKSATRQTSAQLNPLLTPDKLQKLGDVSQSYEDSACVRTQDSTPLMEPAKDTQTRSVGQPLSPEIPFEDTCLSTLDVLKLINTQPILSNRILLTVTGPVLRDLQRLMYAGNSDDYLVNLSTDAKTTNASPQQQMQESMPFFEYCLRRCRVYARMTPHDKAFLISSLQRLKGRPVVGMCGDGINDCEALKTADIGISLSGAVTSLCAPFTSMKQSLQNCYDALCEGRGAIVNSFQSFKYITLYALTLVFASVSLYLFGGNLTDDQYLWIDLIVDLPLAVTMAWTHSSRRLTTKLPPHQLVGAPVIASIVGQACIQVIYMIFSLVAITQMPYYKRFEPDTEIRRFDDESLMGYENTVIFLISVWQYVSLNVILSSGQPWRRPRITNMFYMATVLVLTFLHISFYVNIPYVNAIQEWIGLVELPASFRVLLFGLVLSNFLTSYLYEHYFIGWLQKKETKRDAQWNCIDHPIHFNQ